MRSLKVAVFCLAVLLEMPAAPSLALQKEGSVQERQSLDRETLASRAVMRLEQEIGESTKTGGGIAVSASSEPKKETKKSPQDKLNEEHKKAREGGYDKEFHNAIRENGGKRLKEEWKKNCNSRPTKPKDQRELNCY